jgi:hypothetical protein
MDRAPAELEAIFAIARRRMLCPFSLHLSALFRFMPPYDAARRGAKQSVMDGVMTGDASYESTLKAALCIGRRHCRQSQHNGRTFDYRAHFRSRVVSSISTKLVMMTSESIRFERFALLTEWCSLPPGDQEPNSATKLIKLGEAGSRGIGDKRLEPELRI